MIRLASGALFVVLSAAAAAAQTPSPATELILEASFTGPADSAIVDLARGRVYRIEYSGATGVPRVNLMDRRRTRAFLNPRGDGSFELYPAESDLHLLRVEALRPGDTARVRVLADPTATTANRERRSERRGRTLAVGITAGGGAHDAYLFTGGAAEFAGGIDGGTDLEAGLWAGAPRSVFSAVLGVTHQSATGASPAVTWFFIEPRARLWHSGQLEAGGTVRLGMASILNGTVSPSLLAPGGFVSYRISDSPTHRGPRLHLGYSYGFVGNVPARGQRVHRGSAGLVWIF